MDVKKKVLFISYDGLTDPLGQSQILPYITGLSNNYRFTILSCEKPERYHKTRQLIEDICEKYEIRWEIVVFKTKQTILAK